MLFLGIGAGLLHLTPALRPPSLFHLPPTNLHYTIFVREGWCSPKREEGDEPCIPSSLIRISSAIIAFSPIRKKRKAMTR